LTGCTAIFAFLSVQGIKQEKAKEDAGSNINLKESAESDWRLLELQTISDGHGSYSMNYEAMNI
jgi:hypothetical protein